MSNVAAELAELDHWYHTIELPGGVTTPGLYDTPRALSRIPLPQSLRGKRCLDVATADGFWAFEMERRGADEVIAMDLEGSTSLDWPPSRGAVPEADLPSRARFELARRALGSNVQWVPGSVYDLSPEMFGSFDFVFLGSTLIHLRDPVRALAALRTVVRGELLLNEVVSVPLTLLRPRWPAARLVGVELAVWWVPNVSGLARLVESAGYGVLASGGPYLVRFGKGRAANPWQTLHKVALRPLRRLPLALIRNGRDRLGIPHAWVLASPQPELTA